MDGMPGTCTAYAAAKETPAYRVAFGSGLPRLVALPAGSKQDTRTVAGFAGLVSATGPAVGPGAHGGRAVQPAARLRLACFSLMAWHCFCCLHTQAIGAGSIFEQVRDPNRAASTTCHVSTQHIKSMDMAAATQAGTRAWSRCASAPSTPHTTRRPRTTRWPWARPRPPPSRSTARCPPTACAAPPRVHPHPFPHSHLARSGGRCSRPVRGWALASC